MGCGRSTMGSDSPSRNSKQDEDWADGVDPQTSQKVAPPTGAAAGANSHQGMPFNQGGILLAQAKISGSQLDFFRVLDEKIESGPDYQSDPDEEGVVLKKSRLKMYLDQWNQLTCGKEHSEGPRDDSDCAPLIRSSSGAVGPTIPGAVDDDYSSSASDPESAAKEAVKEQYMFMGNLYTLTRLRSDGSYAPRVDISPAHRGEAGDDSDDGDMEDHVTGVSESLSSSVDVVVELGGAAPDPGVVCLGRREDAAVVKVNGAYPKGEQPRVRRLERADTPFHNTVAANKTRVPPRPASLVLRSVFPHPEEAA